MSVDPKRRKGDKTRQIFIDNFTSFRILFFLLFFGKKNSQNLESFLPKASKFPTNVFLFETASRQLPASNDRFCNFFFEFSVLFLFFFPPTNTSSVGRDFQLEYRQSPSNGFDNYPCSICGPASPPKESKRGEATIVLLVGDSSEAPDNKLQPTTFQRPLPPLLPHLT